MSEETVTITKKRLAELERAKYLLDCLRACGVDNWDGWGDALNMVEEAENES